MFAVYLREQFHTSGLSDSLVAAVKPCDRHVVFLSTEKREYS